MRPLAESEVDQLHHDGRDHQAHQEALGFVPNPGTEALVGEFELTLEPEAVVVETDTQCLADHQQQQQVKKQGQRIVLASA